ncbi:GPI biosynthesis protein family Pig-F-domain-containing protein, partial [Mycena pura]
MPRRRQQTAPAREPAPTPPPATVPPAASGYFPFATYTAAVGVHTTLHLFSALFLPRTPRVAELLAPDADPSQLTSRDRPQHPFLEPLTRSPAASLVCACAGAAVLQAWWGGWVRTWWIEFSLRGANVERRVDRARADARKFTNLWKAWLATAVASGAFHAVLVLFGAPLTSHVLKTYLLALLLALLTVFPPAYTLGAPLLAPDAVLTRLVWTRLFAEFSARTPMERALLYPAVGTVLGAWVGAIPIALDWDRPWQAWPLTPAAGAIAGYILASIAALTANAIRFFADEHVRSLRVAAAERQN